MQRPPLDQARQGETVERPEALSEGVSRPELGQPREGAFSSRVGGDPYLLVEQAFAAKVAQLQGAGDLRRLRRSPTRMNRQRILTRILMRRMRWISRLAGRWGWGGCWMLKLGKKGRSLCLWLCRTMRRGGLKLGPMGRGR